MRKRKQLDAMLASASLQKQQYFRLMVLATSEMLFTTPIAAFSIYLDLTLAPVSPYKSWADTHSDYSRVSLVAASVWRSVPLGSVATELSRWSLVLCATVFFAIFGFSDEARRTYRTAFWAVAKPLGLKPSPKPSLGPLE